MISDCRKDVVEALCVECLYDIGEYKRKFKEKNKDPGVTISTFSENGHQYWEQIAYWDGVSLYKTHEKKLRDLLFTLKITASNTVQLSDADVTILRRKYV